MAEGHILTFHLERLKLFTGTREEAFALACLDRDQYIIHEIIAYRGNPLSRTTLEFEVVFADGELKWIPYSKDLYDSLPYEHYCRSHPELQFLIYPYAEQLRRERETKGAKITAVKPGDKVYVDLRSYGATWYQSLPLPDKDHKKYVLEYIYGRRISDSKIKAECVLFQEVFTVDNLFVVQYGSIFTLQPEMILIDMSLCLKIPELLPDNNRNRLLKIFKSRLQLSSLD